MIRKIVIAMSGKEIVRLKPENEGDERLLNRMARTGQLDWRESFGDEPEWERQQQQLAKRNLAWATRLHHQMRFYREPRSRYRGALLGLAIGDAVGTTLEFKPPGKFQPIGDMIGGGPFGLKPGQWTDDTSMALCLASSLVERRAYDPGDQMERYVRWYRHGYLSSNGKCFDVGNTVRAALQLFERTREPYAGPTDSYSAGNGSLMRLAPVPLFFAQHPVQAIEKSGDSSRTTHGAQTAIDACRYYGALIVGAIHGATKAELLAGRYAPILGYWDTHPLCPEVDAVARGSFKRKEPPQIRGTGYVVHALEAALWAFCKCHTFREGCLLAVNLGEDADTTGAIFGQLAGAFYGEEEIPAQWRAQVAERALLESLAEQILGLAQTGESKEKNG